MDVSPTLLLIEHDSKDARRIRGLIQRQDQADFDLVHVTRLSEGLDRVALGGAGIILLDLAVPGANGLEACDRLHAAAPDVPVIVLTGDDDERLATEALQRGAQDYLRKSELDAPLI